MVIDLKNAFLSDGTSGEKEYDLNLSEVELGGVKPFCAPVKVWAKWKSFAGSVEFSAKVVYTLSMPCDRCFETTVREYTRVFSHTLVRELSLEEDDDAYILVPDERLDLDELIREDILLDMPTKFLCSEDCRGLCPKCGQNLNEGDCGCDRDGVDPRWSVLKELL